MNGLKFFGKVLRVYLKSEFESLDPNACLVFQNLPQEITEEEILKLLKPFGNPFSVRVVRKEKEGEETRAFVQFEKLETAKRAIEELKGTQIGGRDIQLELANRKNKVFIKAKFHETAIEELKKTLEGWKYEESETPEVSADKVYFIALLKFESEETALSFLSEYRTNPNKCELNRPVDFERS
jgi:RNA recognition motif-containing protein